MPKLNRQNAKPNSTADQLGAMRDDELDDVDQDTGTADEPITPAEPATPAAAAPVEIVYQATPLTVMLARLPRTTWGLHLDVQLTPEQSQVLRGITQALDANQATLANGTRITRPAHAVRYLFEQLLDTAGLTASG